MGKMSNGLPELRKSPPLDGGSDCEHLTPDGPDSELGLGPLPALSPFSSNCEPARYKNGKSPNTNAINMITKNIFFKFCNNRTNVCRLKRLLFSVEPEI